MLNFSNFTVDLSILLSVVMVFTSYNLELHYWVHKCLGLLYLLDEWSFDHFEMAFCNPGNIGSYVYFDINIAIPDFPLLMLT